MIRRLVILAAALLASCATDAPKAAFVAEPVAAPVEVHFWLREGASASSDPRITWVDGHPCGGAAGMRVTTIPADTAAIQAEVLSEFDAGGKEIGIWRVPVDFAIDQVRGDLIGISDNNGLNLWVDRSGRLFQRAPGGSPQEPVDCPVLDRYGHSDYLRCFSTHDAGTGHKRLIAWQGICT
jgi:hypothetical protein